MMTKRELLDWIDTLPDDAEIGIDEGGLALQTLATADGNASYLEIGGLPEQTEEEVADVTA